MKRIMSVFLILVFATVAGCSGSTGNNQPAVKPEKPKDPVTLTVSLGTDVTTLDPQLQSNMITMNVLLQTFDTLLTRDKDRKIAPNLATEWKALDDRTWQFKLRRDVKFHNGEPFNAEAVKFSIDRINNPDTKSPIAIVAGVTVEVVDEYTVNLKTKEPDPLIPAKMTLFPGTMMAPQYFKKVGDAGFGTKPVGTGPFKFVEWLKDDKVTLERNPDYWGEKAKVDKLVFKVIPSNPTRVAALQAGDVDIIYNVPPESIPTLKATGKFKTQSVPGMRAFWVQLNAKNPNSPLFKKEVRQAINYGVDVDTLVKTVLEGHATRIPTIVSRDAFGFSGDIKPYEYNPAKAKELLAAAGYPNGFDITLDSPIGVYLKDKDVVEAIAGMLSKVGIRVKVNFLDFNNMLKDLRVDKVNDMYFLSNLGWTMDAYNTLQSYAKTGRIYARHTNKAMDPWVDIEETTMDSAKRLEAFKNIQEILKEEAYYLFLYTGNEIYGVSNKVDWEGPGSQVMHFNTAVKR